MLEGTEEILRWTASRRRQASGSDPKVRKTVRNIIERVEEDRDKALRELAKELDGVELKEIVIDVKKDPKWMKDTLYASLQESASRIWRLSLAQLPENDVILRSKGYDVSVKYYPYNRIGAYVPGGKQGYPSTLLMCAIPARAAGVREVVVCTPKPTRALLMAAHIAGVRKIYNVGGAQAIAAMAFGTLSVPKVEKIVGPGNAYVTEAKLALREKISIDVPAGPSEIVILADTTSNPEYIALDLLAQAEHGPGGMCLCISTSSPMARKVERSISKRMTAARDIPSWLRSSIALGVIKELDGAIEIVNDLAPEHVSVACADADRVAERITNAGTVCIGRQSAVAFGDYSTGANHVLPTGGWAKVRGGLSVLDFIRHVQYIRVTEPEGIAKVGMEIARAEGFRFHEESMGKRKGRR